MNETNATWSRDDRDLLIELKTTMQSVRDDIKDLKDGTSKRLDNLEQDVSSLKFWRGVLLGMWILTTVVIIPLAVAYIGTGKL